MNIPLKVLQDAELALRRVHDLPCDAPVPSALWCEVLRAWSALSVRLDRILRELPAVEVTHD